MKFWGIVLLSFCYVSLSYGAVTTNTNSECAQLISFFNAGGKQILPADCGEVKYDQSGHITDVTIRTKEILNLDFSSFPKLPNLNYLALDGSLYKDGAFPSALLDLPSLKTLHVMNSNISKISILNKCSLELLSVYKANLSGFPGQVLSCKNLKTLDLSYNNIGVIPDSISQLKNLSELLLIDTNLTKLSDKVFDLNITQLHINKNPNLKQKIYKFGAPVKECALDKTIDCLEPGTCIEIRDDFEKENSTVLKESDFQVCKDTRKKSSDKEGDDDNSGGGSKSILLIVGGFAVVIVGCIIGCCCFKKFRKDDDESYRSFQPPVTQNNNNDIVIKENKAPSVVSDDSSISVGPIELSNTVNYLGKMNNNSNGNNNTMNVVNNNNDNNNINAVNNENNNYVNNGVDNNGYYNTNNTFDISYNNTFDNNYNNNNNINNTFNSGYNNTFDNSYNNNVSFNTNGYNTNGYNNDYNNNNNFVK